MLGESGTKKNYEKLTPQRSSIHLLSPLGQEDQSLLSLRIQSSVSFWFIVTGALVFKKNLKILSCKACPPKKFDGTWVWDKVFFWSSSSNSNNRNNAWNFNGDNGNMDNNNRINTNSVRCVASSRDKFGMGEQ